MWRETRQRVTFVVVALVAAGCTSGDADSTSTTQLSTTSTAIETTTTAAQPTTTTTSETTTTPIEFTDAVGSPETLTELVDEALANSALMFPGIDLSGIERPDLNTPDPTEAAAALARLEYQVSATAPNISWLDVVTAIDSPARSSLARGLQELSNRRLRVVLDSGEYLVDGTEVVTLQALTNRSSDVPVDIPDGAAFVLITTSSPSYQLVDSDGEATASRPGWDRRTRGVILQPTDVGWQLYWEEEA
jgi:hypothetical protein